MFASGSEGASSWMAPQAASRGGIDSIRAKAPIMAVLTMGWVRLPRKWRRAIRVASTQASFMPR